MLLHHFLGNGIVITKFMFWFALLSSSEAAQAMNTS